MTLHTNLKQPVTTRARSISFRYGSTYVEIFDRRDTRLNAQPIRLTGQERKLIFCIAQMEGRVAAKQMLLQAMYPEGVAKAEHKIIDVLVCHIRAKLAAKGDVAALLRTVRGRGYALGFPRATPAIPPKNFPQCNGRWVASRKLLLLHALEKGEETIDRLMEYYPDLSRRELVEWSAAFRTHGFDGLKVTKMQN